MSSRFWLLYVLIIGPKRDCLPWKLAIHRTSVLSKFSLLAKKNIVLVYLDAPKTWIHLKLSVFFCVPDNLFFQLWKSSLSAIKKRVEGRPMLRKSITRREAPETSYLIWNTIYNLRLSQWKQSMKTSRVTKQVRFSLLHTKLLMPLSAIFIRITARHFTHGNKQVINLTWLDWWLRKSSLNLECICESLAVKFKLVFIMTFPFSIFFFSWGRVRVKVCRMNTSIPCQWYCLHLLNIKKQ